MHTPACLFGLLTLLLTTVPAAAQPTVQNSAGKIDDNGCFAFEATVRVEQPIDSLYNALSRPEALWIHVADVRPDVFVGFPWTKDVIAFNVRNSFSITDPFSKIVELSFIMGASGPAPERWMEYRFSPKAYRIWEEQIGSTNPSGVFPEFQAEYSLTPSDDKSSTSVRYTRKRCFPADQRSRLANERREENKSEEDWIKQWLTAAENECDRMRTAALSTPTAIPPTAVPGAGPTGTPLPMMAP